MDTEEWRTIPGYEGRYEASSHGRVRSLGFHYVNRWGTKTWQPGRVLTPTQVTGSKYLALELTSGTSTRRMKLHRVILLAFRGEPPADAPNGLHKDDNPENNHIDNLRWGSQADNLYDCVDNGNHAQASKRTCALGHLLVAPNLVESASRRGFRDCLTCKQTKSNHQHDAKLREQGRERTRANRGRDGFLRRAGETFEEEARRRYAHIMRNHVGL